MNKQNNIRFRTALVILAVLGLLAVFLFQQVDLATMLGIKHNSTRFMVNRTIRFVLNDTLTILLIYGLFFERKYVVFAIWVQVFGLVFVLIPYFMIKLYYPSYNGPLISFLHRLILNPTLLILLIPAFYYQRIKVK